MNFKYWFIENFFRYFIENLIYSMKIIQISIEGGIKLNKG